MNLDLVSHPVRRSGAIDGSAGLGSWSMCDSGEGAVELRGWGWGTGVPIPPCENERRWGDPAAKDDDTGNVADATDAVPASDL